MKQIIAVLLFLAVAAHGQVIGDTLTIQSQTPSGAQGIAAGAVGAAGTTNLYYFVATRYASGLVLPGIPVLASNTVGIANLTGVNRVQIGWSAAPGATGYYVIRGTTQTFLNSGVCTACVVVANTAATGFSDVGGGTTNWPPAGVPTAAPARFDMILDNYSESEPFLRVNIGGLPGRLPIQFDSNDLLAVSEGIVSDTGAVFESTATDGQYQWRTGSSLFIGAEGGGNVSWNDRVGAVDGFGARIENNMATTTSMQGADIRVTTDGGNGSPATLAMGIQGVGIAAAGTVSLGELYGGNFVTLDQAGGGVNRFGVVGNLAFSGTTTGGSLYNAGVYGEYNDGTAAGLSIPGTNFTGAMIGIVNSTGAAARPSDAAIIAAIASGNPTAAFMVLQLNNNPGKEFDFGLDLMGTTGFNAYAVADIRGEQGEYLANPAAGLWLIDGPGTVHGLTNAGMTFANLGAQPDSTWTFCTDCDPTAGAVAACASAGAQTGAIAFRINGQWDCLSR